MGTEIRSCCPLNDPSVVIIFQNNSLFKLVKKITESTWRINGQLWLLTEAVGKKGLFIDPLALPIADC